MPTLKRRISGRFKKTITKREEETLKITSALTNHKNKLINETSFVVRKYHEWWQFCEKGLPNIKTSSLKRWCFYIFGKGHPYHACKRKREDYKK